MDRELEDVMQFKTAEDRAKIKQYFTNPKSIDSSKMTFVFSTPSETGTSYFRLFEPIRALYKNFGDEANYIYTECIQPNHFQLADCIIMHRAGNLHSHFLSVSRMWPKTEKRPLIIHDVDDNEFNLPKSHPMAEIWYASQKDKMSIQSLKHSDWVMTTTNKLSKTFKTFNNNVKIQRNQFDWDLPQWNLDKNEIRKEMIPEWFPSDDKIVIGWAGLTSHFEDIKRMHAIIKMIHDKHPQTVFVLAGMAVKDSQVEIEYLDGKPHFKEKAIDNENETYRSRVKNLYSDIDPNRIKIFDALPLEEYAKFYTLFDISLAYIEHNAFNSCKSEIKVIEGLHYGCIPVFSQYGGYKDFTDILPNKLRNNNCAVSVWSPRRWVSALDYWIERFNTDEHINYIADLKSFADDYYDINLHCEERLTWLLEKTEEHAENQINGIAQYSDFYGE